MCKSLLVFYWYYVCTSYRLWHIHYSASKNGVTLKLGVGVVQGHLKWRWSIDHTTFYCSAIVRIVVCCIIFKLFDVESGHWRSFKLVPFESLDAVFYSPSVVTMAVSLTVYEISSSKEKRDTENWVFCSRSLKMAPFTRALYDFLLVGHCKNSSMLYHF